ncbi:SGNH/GDSL hydrolase family protein [Rhodoferax koreensis]|nr:SGNH/GDSL hydrolase family protein [Rhodoferax koreense]
MAWNRMFGSGLAAGLMALVLTGCGGGGGGDQSPTVKFSALVSFGDSLSDVGSYRTPGIAAVGGGKYTVNGTDGQIWVERIASQLSLPAPCAAQTGLNASGQLAAFAGPVVDHPGCTGYAQGGSRVTNPIGPWNAALLASPDPDTAFEGQLGQLTVPVATQIATHLARSAGSFSGSELVLVMAGGNDVFSNLATVGVSTTPEQAATAMGTAGAELAALVKTQILAKGAKYVVVVNLPNVSLTPSTLAAEATAPGTKALTDTVTKAFNNQLAAGLAGTAGVVQVDAYAQSTDQTVNPAAYALSNVTTPACSSTSALNPLPGYSLTCTTASTLPVDVSHYLYADGVHPTPFGHSLLARLVSLGMSRAGWL